MLWGLGDHPRRRADAEKGPRWGAVREGVVLKLGRLRVTGSECVGTARPVMPFRASLPTSLIPFFIHSKDIFGATVPGPALTSEDIIIKKNNLPYPHGTQALWR